MSTTTLTFSIPEEQEEARLAQEAGSIAAAISDLDSRLRDRAKYGSPKEQTIRVDEVRRMLTEALEERGVLWVLGR